MTILTPPEFASADNWRLTPATFAHRLSHGRWIPAKHLLYVSAIIAAAIHKGGARLIISFPPRHGKSELISINTTAWFLERFPEKYVMLSSYGSELATDFGRKARDLILENPDNLLSVRLRHDSLQVSRFLTTKGGGMFAVGVGGAMTGRGAHLLLVDDYLKNTEDAESTTVRGKIYDWLISTALTRLEPNASVIIIATRWHLDDATGRLKLRTEGDWTEICLPAIAGEGDPLGRLPGEALWPERYDLNALAAIKGTLGTYYWQALYQQAPTPRTASQMQGGWLQPEDISPHLSHMRIIRFWDLAATAAGGDWTVGIKLGKHKETGFYHILDLKRDQLSPYDTEKLIKATAKDDGKEVAIGIEQEPGSSGKTVIDHYVRVVLQGYNVRGMKSTGDKFVRAQPFFAAAEAGIVRMKRAGWNAELIDECTTFPDGPHDDQVDALSGGYKELNSPRYGGVVWGRDSNPYSGPRTEDVVKSLTFGR